VLYCVSTYEQFLKLAVSLGLGFFRFRFVFCAFFGHFIPLFDFIVLGLVSSVLRKKLPSKNVSKMTCFVMNMTLNLN